jgi:hypothetical protein
MASRVLEGAGVIVEPRCHKALAFSVGSVRRNIPSEWPIFVLHGRQNVEYVQVSLRNIANVYFINMNVDNLTLPEYNFMLASSMFYERFAPYLYLLVFQTDSMLCDTSRHKIQDFLGFDYVGAPWSFHRNRVGNGGLSLRRREAMVTLTTKYPYPKLRDPRDNEDLYISKRCNRRAPVDLARQFSVESLFSPVTNQQPPFGVHKPWKHLKADEWFRLVSMEPGVKQLLDLNVKDTK